jgi:hypothetical protein
VQAATPGKNKMPQAVFTPTAVSNEFMRQIAFQRLFYGRKQLLIK